MGGFGMNLLLAARLALVTMLSIIFAMLLRQLKAVQTMKRLILDNNLVMMSTISRCACAYEALAHQDGLEDSSKAYPGCRPGVVCARLRALALFGGEIDPASIAVHSLGCHENTRNVSDARLQPAAHKHPRVISGTWKYTSGAVGSFTYVVALQGRMSNSEFDVFADGYRFRLINACLEPTLYIRRPGTDIDEQLTFSDEDSEPSLSEGLEYARDRHDSAFSVSALSPKSDNALDISQGSLMQAIRAASKREWKAAVEA